MSAFIGAVEWEHGLNAQQKMDLRTIALLQPDLEKAIRLYPNAKLTMQGRGKDAPETRHNAIFNPMFSAWSTHSILVGHFGLNFLADKDLWPRDKMLFSWEHLPQ